MDRERHWESVYERADLTQVSWFQSRPDESLRFIEAADLDTSDPILDVGGGTSTLVDSLLDLGYVHLGVLDVSPRAIAVSRERLGSRADAVEWYVGDATDFRSPHPWDLWHDRAVFHFLTKPEDQSAYGEALKRALAPDGQAVIATFGPEGPTRCSGLDVFRHDADSLGKALGGWLELVEQEVVEHTTPGGVTQQFIFCRFRRAG
jgi:SAM-dependent methyltransferase